MKEVQIPKRAVISHGAHTTYGDGACAMEWADYLNRRRNGERITRATKLRDQTECVCPRIRAFMISWNDGIEGDSERNRLLRDLIPICVGTNTSERDSDRRGWICVDWIVRTYVPKWIRLAGLGSEARKLASLPEIQSEKDLETMEPQSAAQSAAYSAARSAVYSAADSAAYSAAQLAARSAAYLAARSAAYLAAYSAARSVAWSAAYLAARSVAWSAARSVASPAVDSAARSALAPTVAELQASAQDLVRRMCEVGR